jgi:hypothetical protein
MGGYNPLFYQQQSAGMYGQWHMQQLLRQQQAVQQQQQAVQQQVALQQAAQQQAVQQVILQQNSQGIPVQNIQVQQAQTSTTPIQEGTTTSGLGASFGIGQSPSLSAGTSFPISQI